MTEATTEKKKRKRTPAYKNVNQTSTFGAVADAFNALTDLASECREIVDNASEGLSQTQRIQTFDETAGTLESVSEVDVPDCLGDVELVYGEMVSTNKRRGPRRATRCANIVSILQAAAEQARSIAEEHHDAAEAWENADDATRNSGEMAEPEYTTDQCSEMETFADDLDSVVSDIEGCEFPGMYG